MRATTRRKWDEYQRFMAFLMEWLPAIKTRRRGRIVVYEELEVKYEGSDETHTERLPVRQDYYESLVRRYLRLPTVQQSRRELDTALKRTREREMHRVEEEAQFAH